MAAEIKTIYQFSKTQIDEKRFYAQVNEEVYEASANPPATIVGPFGSLVFTNSLDITKVKPASWDKIDDVLMFSDGGDQHQLFPGNTQKIDGAKQVIDSSPHPRIIVDGVTDFTEAVREPDSSDNFQVAIGDYVNDDDALYIGSPLKASAFNLIFDIVNALTSTVVIEYLSENVWTAVSGLVDGTASGGNTFAQDGTISFDAPDHNGEFLFGETLFWYRISAASGGDITATIKSITYNGPWQALQNMFDGFPVDVVEAQVAGPFSTYQVFPASTIDLSSVDGTDGGLYVATADPIDGLFFDFGQTPSTASAGVIGIEYKDSVTQAFTAASNIEDGTNNLRQSGWITFDPPANVTKFSFNGSLNDLYWYRITFSSTLPDNVSVGLTYKPIYDINELGIFGNVSAAWKNRGVYSFANFPSFLYVSANDRPNVLNGSDFAILQAGDGRRNQITCMKKFQNELMVWQEEKGREGGCLTLFEGFNPATFGKLIISIKTGTFSPKSAVVVDGTLTSTRRDDTKQTLAYFISHYGIFVTDGRIVTAISDPIQNYFDPRFDECIRRGFEMEMWVEHDTSHNILRFGLVSGSTAEEPNIFPVYDLNDGTWSFDTYPSGEELSCMTEVESDTGQFHVLQYAGAVDGFVRRVNIGLNDDGSAIDMDVRMELNANANMIEFREFINRARVDDTDLSFQVYKDGIENVMEAETIDLSIVEETGDEHVRTRFIKGTYQDSNISIRLRNNVIDEDLYLYDFSMNLDVLADR